MKSFDIYSSKSNKCEVKFIMPCIQILRLGIKFRLKTFFSKIQNCNILMNEELFKNCCFENLDENNRISLKSKKCVYNMTL